MEKSIGVSFSVGDRVRLISGGPDMTIEKIHENDNTVTCIWFWSTEKSLCKDFFQIQTLKLSGLKN